MYLMNQLFKRFCLIFLTLVLLLYTSQNSVLSVSIDPDPAAADAGLDDNAAKGDSVSQVAENPTSDPLISTGLGDLTYYNQSDPRWSDYLYGGRDPLSTHGCGPTVVSMIVSSFTDTPMNPAQMAQWACEHGYWSSGSGSSHALIPDSLSAFGLHVESIHDYSQESLFSLLNSGKILVLLMGSGHFTKTGHFLIVTGVSPDGQMYIADPNNAIYTNQTWNPSIITDELRISANAGGPVWAISKQ